MNLISLVMVVKDEEENIERCLESVKGLCDEIIIVDTGSKDKTVEIVKRYGAKVFHENWNNDFSFFRNIAVEKATGKWCIQLDADEILVYNNSNPEDFRKRLSLADNENIDVIGIRLKDIRGIEPNTYVKTDVEIPRIFKRGKAHYKRIVHNKLIFSGICAYSPQLQIHHFGYEMDEVKKEAKKKRIIGMLKMGIEKDPEDKELIFYLSQAYSFFGMLEASIEEAEKYLTYEKEEGEKFRGEIFATLAEMYSIFKDKEKFLNTLEKGLSKYPDDLDLLFLKVQFGIETGNREIIQLYGQKFLLEYVDYERKVTSRKGRFCNSYTPEKYAFCYYHLALTKFEDGLELINNLIIFSPMLNKTFSENLISELELNLGEILGKTSCLLKQGK